MRRCKHPLLRPSNLAALRRAAQSPAHPLFLVDRRRAIPPDFPQPRGETWRSCRDGVKPAGSDLVCIPVPWTHRPTALRQLAWDSAAPRRPRRTHDRLRVGYRGRIGFKALQDAAMAEAGAELFVTSAFRPYAVQAAIFEDHVQREMAKGRDRVTAMANSAMYSARPGHSEHQLGTTADLTYRRPDGELSGFGRFMAHEMRASWPMRWVRANAHRFGLAMTYRADRVAESQYVWEPWHWRFVGVAAADAMHACDLSVAELVEHVHGAAPPERFAGMAQLERDEAAVAPDVAQQVARPGERVALRWWLVNLGGRQWQRLSLRPLAVDPALREVPWAEDVDVDCVPVFDGFSLARQLTAPARPGRYDGWWELVHAGDGAPVAVLAVSLVVLPGDGAR